jgi:hypothetical protein
VVVEGILSISLINKALFLHFNFVNFVDYDISLHYYSSLNHIILFLIMFLVAYTTFKRITRSTLFSTKSVVNGVAFRIDK